MSKRPTGRGPASPPGHMDQIIRSSRSPSRGRRAQRVLRILGLAGIFALVVGVVAAAIFAYAQFRFRSNQEVIEGLSTKVPSQPMNVLVLGSDTRDVLSEEERKSFGTVEGKRADTIILLHLDEKQEKAVLVHFPRDLRITHADGSPGKINAVYGKGADEMVRQVKELTGLPVHHYVEVNFKGFNNIVNTLGGIKVHFERPIKDPESELDVPKGCVQLDGSQALAFVRVRKIDDDFGRIARQQLFVKLMMEKTMTAGTLLNPAKLVKLVNLFADNVAHDADLTVGDVKSIAFRLRGFDAGRVDMRVVPSAGARIRGVSYVVANKSESDALFDALRNRRPLPPFGRTGVSPIEPPDVRLSVLNGTSVDKLAQTQADVLRTKGFQIIGTGGADAHSRTTVYFRKGFEEHAKLVAASYAAPVLPMPGSITANGDVALVLGKNFGAAPAQSPAPQAPRTPPPAAAKPLAHPCEER